MRSVSARKAAAQQPHARRSATPQRRASRVQHTLPNQKHVVVRPYILIIHHGASPGHRFIACPLRASVFAESNDWLVLAKGVLCHVWLFPCPPLFSCSACTLGIRGGVVGKD